MSWNYDLQAKCDLFYLVRTSGSPGDVASASVEGDPVDDVNVRVATASCTIRGRFHTACANGQEFTTEGPNWKCPLTAEPQVLPAGMTINTAETPVVGMCAQPVKGKKLSREFVHGSENFTRVFAEPTYVVVADGDVTINGKALPPFTIGRGTSFDVQVTGTALVVFIWERT